MTTIDIAGLITAHLQPYLDDHGLYLVDIRVALGRRIEILADSDNGITITECVQISRYLEGLPELESVFENHALEVSSPGVDEPLHLHRQFVKNVGRKLAVTLTDGRKIEGDLETVTEEGLILQSYTQIKNIRKDIKTVEIPMKDIKEAIVQIKFN